MYLFYFCYTAANDSQQRPTKANAGQRRPTTANGGQRRSTKAHSGQWQPTKAHQRTMLVLPASICPPPPPRTRLTKANEGPPMNDIGSPGLHLPSIPTNKSHDNLLVVSWLPNDNDTP